MILVIKIISLHKVKNRPSFESTLWLATMDSSSVDRFSDYNGSEFINVVNERETSEAQWDAKEGEWRTLVSQRLTPPNAVIKYMITIAIWLLSHQPCRKHWKYNTVKKTPHTDIFSKFSRISRKCTHNPKRSVPDTYVCQCAQKNMNMPTKPQKNVQLG